MQRTNYKLLNARFVDSIYLVQIIVSLAFHLALVQLKPLITDWVNQEPIWAPGQLNIIYCPK